MGVSEVKQKTEDEGYSINYILLIRNAKKIRLNQIFKKSNVGQKMISFSLKELK